jgi:hypothetical protein
MMMVRPQGKRVLQRFLKGIKTFLQIHIQSMFSAAITIHLERENKDHCSRLDIYRKK